MAPPVRILCVTFNLGNQQARPPSRLPAASDSVPQPDAAFSAFLGQASQGCDLVVVATQEAHFRARSRSRHAALSLSAAAAAAALISTLAAGVPLLALGLAGGAVAGVTAADEVACRRALGVGLGGALGSAFVPLLARSLGQTRLHVYSTPALRPRLACTRVFRAAAGRGGLPNKGALGLALTVDATSFAFLACHLVRPPRPAGGSASRDASTGAEFTPRTRRRRTRALPSRPAAPSSCVACWQPATTMSPMRTMWWCWAT